MDYTKCPIHVAVGPLNESHTTLGENVLEHPSLKASSQAWISIDTFSHCGLQNSQPGPHNLVYVSRVTFHTTFNRSTNKNSTQDCSGKPNKVQTCFSKILAESWSGASSIGFGSPRRRISRCFCIRSIFDGQFRAQIHVLDSGRKKVKKYVQARPGIPCQSWRVTSKQSQN